MENATPSVDSFYSQSPPRVNLQFGATSKSIQLTTERLDSSLRFTLQRVDNLEVKLETEIGHFDETVIRSHEVDSPLLSDGTWIIDFSPTFL